ncbi:FAD-binding oxidoreductase [Gulosibacter chungangensis]|uniref:FAD-binding oxidoreductase n=2 Tax=Gulosibacter chungangensis TaxID=979746 RepID=A0A7J5BGR1_9MICO|nr:Chain A, FAD-binding oxidoreductase [Gulosibacter chungangensis]7PBG_B Chain B, FAD-binding oxidoreductase [Gulosibacter chungangensis]7PBI_A Chain A, FAD-binding oxidoreductase [Gulosibacter chungangensis]7PBI_B Chain B, FAD-binding oxidoreductase [Gulosibacter chungangensis]7PBI_C Chain C, FAD-binding oxidoreductase [Gulosibacter chungangensis]7PBI_D Chain D, FAD-binding oxidoreductase [Gulosibacter chungangensis]7PBI_E Chain E, FAD-binding oxidoreductase [Gulosibacter chungangensis]7PB
MNFRTLPDGVSAEQFANAISEFSETIGSEYVRVDEATVSEYDDKFPVTDGDEFKGSAVIWPGSTEDVQVIVRIANKYGIPLHAFSGGRNLGYGGSSPMLTGTVLLHLGKRMNRVLEINEKLAYAVVEPGVDYKTLYEAVRDSGAKLMIDPAELDWGSVMGNTMEHGVGYTPYADHSMWRCGMEVVLADGEVLRTGMGGLPGSEAWHLYPGQLGPSIEGLFEQSNFGICTRMGMQLMPTPPEMLSFAIYFENEDDLPAIMETTLPLRIGMAPLQAAPIVRNVTFDAACVSKREEWQTEPGPLTDEAKQRMVDELGIGHWIVYGTCYGPRWQIDKYIEMIRDAYLQIPGARFETNETLPLREGDRASELLNARHELNTGVPNRHSAAVFDWFPNAGHFFYAPVSAPSGEDAAKQYEDTKRISDDHGIDYLAQFIIGLREMHHICLPLYDTADPASRKETLDMTRELIRAGAEEGYGIYRAHNVLADQVAETYSFNNHIQRRSHERIKDALDPNGILNPGKSGIWPERLRNK